MADISMDQVKDYLGNLTVLELSELVKTLEEEWSVSAAAPVAAVAMAPGAGGGDAGAAAEEQTEFDVMLIAAGDKKIQVIKAIREITGLGLKDAKEMVDNAPKAIKEAVSKEEAAEIQGKIEEAGGSVELK